MVGKCRVEGTSFKLHAATGTLKPAPLAKLIKQAVVSYDLDTTSGLAVGSEDQQANLNQKANTVRAEKLGARIAAIEKAYGKPDAVAQPKSLLLKIKSVLEGKTKSDAAPDEMLDALEKTLIPMEKKIQIAAKKAREASGTPPAGPTKAELAKQETKEKAAKGWGHKMKAVPGVGKKTLTEANTILNKFRDGDIDQDKMLKELGVAFAEKKGAGGTSDGVTMLPNARVLLKRTSTGWVNTSQHPDTNSEGWDIAGKDVRAAEGQVVKAPAKPT